MTDNTSIYVRVSTPDQSVDAQLQQCADYARDTFDANLDDLEVYRDVATGSNTDRSGFRSMLNDAEDGTVDTLVVKEISRLSRNMRDLNRTVGQLTDHDVELHVIDSGLKINNNTEDAIVDDRIIMQVLGMAAEMEHKMTVQRTMTGIRAAQAEGKHTGRPPYGFTTDSEGYLVPTDDFETALAAIELVEAGESKRQTCRHTGINHSTLNNILDSREFYRSNEPENDVQA